MLAKQTVDRLESVWNQEVVRIEGAQNLAAATRERAIVSVAEAAVGLGDHVHIGEMKLCRNSVVPSVDTASWMTSS